MSARQKQKTLNSKNSGRFLHIRNLRSVEGILIVATNRPKDKAEKLFGRQTVKEIKNNF